MRSWRNGQTSPEMLYLETKWASLIPFARATDLLKEVLPVGDLVNAETVRNHLQLTAERIEQELGEERQLNRFEGSEQEWERQPLPDGPITVGIDGGYVRAAHKQGWFEVIAGKSVVAFRRDDEGEVPSAKCFGFVQTYDEKPRRRLWELMKSQGMQENQQVVFMSDGGENVRRVQEYLHPFSEHLIDWFHITMRLTVLQQQTKALQEERPETGAELSKRLESVKHLLWHGNTEEALERLGTALLGEGLEPRPAGVFPIGEEPRGGIVERGELGVAEDGGLHLANREPQLTVAGAVELLERGGAQTRHGLPVIAKRIKVVLRDAAAQMAVDVLQILRLSAVDVAREVEIVVVLWVGDFLDGYHAGVARIALILPVEGVHDLMDVLFAEAVFRAVLHEALRGVDHKDALAGGSVFLVEHEDAGRDARAVKEIRRQADDGLEVARAEPPWSGSFAFSGLPGNQDAGLRVGQRRCVLRGRRKPAQSQVIGPRFGLSGPAQCLLSTLKKRQNPFHHKIQ